MRVKILDAWAWGLPVVSTTIGAEGIDCRHGDNLLVADTATDFVTAVQRVMADHPLANLLALACRDSVGVCYDWKKIYSAWDAIYPI